MAWGKASSKTRCTSGQTSCSMGHLLQMTKYKCILAASTHIPEVTRFMLARVQLWFLHYRNFLKACRGGSSV